MSLPKIQTAIPKRRYKLGEFTLTYLGDIVAEDATPYRYILAMIKDGESEPQTYVTLERAGREHPPGACLMRVLSGTAEQVIGVSDRWAAFDAFVADSLLGIREMYELGDEEPYQLM